MNIELINLFLLLKIVSKIIDNKENMQYLIELADQNEKIVKNTVKNENI